jgi:hypothetical protein
MTKLSLAENPFKVFTPEDMDAEDVHSLFVDPFTDFNKIRDPGHTMVNGPRGCGKSMIFRYLLPDCQCLSLRKSIQDLPALAFLVSIKNTGPNITEFQRLRDRHADIVLNEHVLTAYVATKVFGAVSKFDLPASPEALSEAVQFYTGEVSRRLQTCGATPTPLPANLSNASDVFRHLSTVCEVLYSEVVQYTKRLAFPTEQPIPYQGALCGYLDFLFPLLQDLRRLSFLPKGPIYLLIDDADYLNHTQTVVLNSWLATRTQMDVSIKISTQLRYKSMQTVSGLPVQSPHDFQAINIADVYTTRHGRYLNRVEAIISKRLIKAGIDCSPREFFPPDSEQESEIKAIADRIRNEWQEKGRGHRADDDVTRYARPEYIRALGGTAKSSRTYSYSGFDQLVHISSGLVRYFLEPASLMFDEQQSRHAGSSVKAIDPGIQDQVVREEANNLMFGEFDRIRSEAIVESPDVEGAESGHVEVLRKMDKLRNLICSLGGTFYLKLISDDSERRVFSIAISGPPDREVVEVLDMGVRCGYFHRSSIGNKDGTGRTRLYVLTRRLAPYFKLDPSSFAGYLWLTNEALHEAMANSEAILRKVKKVGVGQYFESSQLTLFEP